MQEKLTDEELQVQEEIKEKAQEVDMKDFEERFHQMWVKTHTPIVKVLAPPGRNEICPYCNSGKKFKNCQCFKDYGEAVYEYDYTRTKKLPLGN